MRSRVALTSLAAGLLAVVAANALAVSLPIVNPGFDATVTGVGFIYEETFYFEGNPMPDHTYTNLPALGDPVSGLGDAATGAAIADAAVTLSGYSGSPGSGLVRDTRDYLPGQGPTGPGAYISYTDSLPRGIFQTLVGTAFQPNTVYTFTADVSDRRFGASDNVSFPSGGAVVPLGVQLSLSGSVEPPGTFTFTAPDPGGTSAAKFVFTTGAAGTPGDPTGDITIIMRTQGFAGLAATQAIFDNLLLTATPAPNADFNDDHRVDGADFLIWQRGFGSGTTHATGDANASGSVDGADLEVWKGVFGSPASLPAATSAPEPATIVASLAAVAILLSGRRAKFEALTAAG